MAGRVGEGGDRLLYALSVAAAVGAALLVVVGGLVPAVIAGLLSRELALRMTPLFRGPVVVTRGLSMATVILGLLLLMWLVGSSLYLGAHQLVNGGLLRQVEHILLDLNNTAPAWLVGFLPGNAADLMRDAEDYLRSHASVFTEVSSGVLHTTVAIILGSVIGALAYVIPVTPVSPFVINLHQRASLLAESFRRVAVAQLQIATINTMLTGVYLLVLLPLADIHLPLVKSMLAATFMLSLIPIVGNTLSNFIIIGVSLTHSVLLAGVSLVFLVFIHTLEHFLSAHLLGGRVNAKAWEVLSVMLLGQALAGGAGLVIAPIFYAWVRLEMARAGLIKLDL